jgi:hypothetical protein
VAKPVGLFPGTAPAGFLAAVRARRPVRHGHLVIRMGIGHRPVLRQIVGAMPLLYAQGFSWPYCTTGTDSPRSHSSRRPGRNSWILHGELCSEVAKLVANTHRHQATSSIIWLA